MITSMVDDFLKKNPDQEKNEQTKADQDMKDCFPVNVITLVNAKKLFKPHFSDMKKKMKNKKEDKEEEKKDVNKEDEKKEDAKAALAQAKPNHIQCKN
jgi:hypothetical protein